jgi:TolA-binding protein
VPDALYKLGVVYGKLGDRDAAERHMRRTRDEFPGTPAAGLAEAYLASPN